MARELLLPELAESVVEGEIIKWLVAEGEYVAEDQPVVEVMTDKVTVELPSPYAGVLEKHLAAEGDVVKVHEAIALFGDGGADADSNADDSARATADAANASTKPASPSVQAAEEAAAFEGSIVEGTGGEEDDGEGLSLFKPGDRTGDDTLIRVTRPGARAGGAATGGTPASAATVSRSTASATGAVSGERPTGVRGAYGRVLAVPAARRLA